MDREFLSITEVAEKLGVSYTIVTNLIKSGRLPSINVGGGQRAKYIIRTVDVLAFTGTAQATPMAPVPQATVWKPTVNHPKPPETPPVDDQSVLGDPQKEEAPIETKRYKIREWIEAAILLTQGCHLDEAHFDRTGNWWYFYFEDTEELRRTLADHYHKQLHINSFEMNLNMRKLKEIMSTQKRY